MKRARTDLYGSWGRLGPVRDRSARPMRFGAPVEAGEGSYLPYGNGKSYGDSCLNDSGLLVDTRGSGRILDFDVEHGVLRAEAGILLSQITRRVGPAGWFLPVTPGTQFVTLGGAIANDVHGKNHHRRGSFGAHVDAIRLFRSDRGILDLSRQSEPQLFAATIGGMGMTGLIGEATIRLMKVPSLTIEQTTRRFDTLAEYFELAAEADARHEYAVAWIDSLSRGSRQGRGHLILGDHKAFGDRSGEARRPIARVPFTPPISPLANLPLRAFNEMVWRSAPQGTSRRDAPFDAFFYPLDRVGEWNRLYGPRGLVQHQSVVPLSAGPEAVAELLDCAGRYRQGSFLTVLKRFGAKKSPGVLSFAREGYTLTLDFPHRGAVTERLLGSLDAITLAAGGAVNPYKDARMAPRTFAAGFPRWPEVEALRDPAIMSDFWRRTAMRLPAEERIRAAS